MVCPSRGERNPDGARFSLNCGVPPALPANLARSLMLLEDEQSDRDWMFACLEPLAGLGDPSAQVDRAGSFKGRQHYFACLAAQHTLVRMAST